MDFFVPLLHFFQKGVFMMYPIAIVMALSVAITIERWLFLSRVAFENRKLWKEAAPLLANGDVATVEQIVSRSDTAVGRILSAGAAPAKIYRHRHDPETATAASSIVTLQAVAAPTIRQRVV